MPTVWTGGFPDYPEAPARLCAQGSHYSIQGPGGEPASAAPGGGRLSPGFALSREHWGAPVSGRLAKNCSRESNCRPCRAPPSPRQLDMVERLAPGPHSMIPWKLVEGLVPYVETVRIPYVYFHGLALEPVFPGRLPATSKRLQSPPIFHMHLTIVQMCNCFWTSLRKVRASAAFLFWAERVHFPSVIQSYCVGSSIATVMDLPMGALTCAKK